MKPCAETRFATLVVGKVTRQYFTDRKLLSFKHALVVIQFLEVRALEAFCAARLRA
jgi:hypothetical protein